MKANAATVDDAAPSTMRVPVERLMATQALLQAQLEEQLEERQRRSCGARLFSGQA
jgi:hypothetical protein